MVNLIAGYANLAGALLVLAVAMKSVALHRQRVREHQDGHPMEHDHRNGECIEETLEYTKYADGRWQRGHNHCNKDVTLDVSCRRQKVNGKKQIVYDFEPPTRYTYIRPKNRRQPPCWEWVCNGHTHGEYDWEERIFCRDKIFTYCQGHAVRVRQPENECVCDDYPPRPTCTLSYSSIRSGRKWRYTAGGVPSAFVTAYYHKPERGRERKLKDMAREYNMNGDIEDYDFENRQARSSVRWIYW